MTNVRRYVGNGQHLRFKILLHFASLLHFALHRVQNVIKNNAKFNKLSTCFMLVVWSETLKYDLEMFSITKLY